MKRLHVFLVVPALRNAGPIKGVVAIANYFVRTVDVTVVALRRSEPVDLNFDRRVNIECLDCYSLFLFPLAIWKYYRLLSGFGVNIRKVSLSVGFSADALNVLVPNVDMRLTSVRGNLIANYSNDYGAKGLALARMHHLLFRFMDKVVVMNESMRQQVFQLSGVKSHIVGNFVDETQLRNCRVTKPKSGGGRFVFVGSLSNRKRVGKIIEAIRDLIDRGYDVQAHIVGDGPLKDDLHALTRELNLKEHIKFHGALPNPYAILQESDVFVLPSLSEGVSRASLEALYFGLPIVLADVDGNKDLVEKGTNGFLVSEQFSEKELADAMLMANQLAVSSTEYKNLLPLHCQQEEQGQNLLDIITRAHGSV